jgi:hypothetical protein
VTNSLYENYQFNNFGSDSEQMALTDFRLALVITTLSGFA